MNSVQLLKDKESKNAFTFDPIMN